jgi:hypothetical protein
MAVVAGAAPTALWHTAHCRLCEPVWATGRRACRAGCLGLSMFGPFCHVCGSLLRRVHRSCVSRRGGADERRRFRLARCGGVCGFEAEDGQEDGTRDGGEPPAAGINQNFAYLDETRLPAPALR